MFERRGYLLDLTDRVPTMRTLQELIDILARYRYNEFRPFVEREFPDTLDFGRLAAYCDMQGIELIRTTRATYEELFLRADYAVVSTEAERSLAGRVEAMREAMIRVEAQGRARKAHGFLVTDFSDGHCWQPVAVSLPGIVMGGAFASGGAKSSMMDLEQELDRVMDAPLGGLLLRLGTLYLRGGAVREHCSELFNVLSHDAGYSRHPGLTQFVLDDIAGVARGVRLAAERWTDRSDWAKEVVYAANLLDCACHRRNEAMLRELRDEHGHVWRLRFQPEGRVESLAKLPRF
ncbi:MAG: hypothetical protein ACI4RD_10835 [Kiritimatiellia bacterium]